MVKQKENKSTRPRKSPDDQFIPKEDKEPRIRGRNKKKKLSPEEKRKRNVAKVQNWRNKQDNMTDAQVRFHENAKKSYDNLRNVSHIVENLNTAYDTVQEQQQEIARLKKENVTLKRSNTQLKAQSTKSGEDKTMIEKMYWAVRARAGDPGSKIVQSLIKDRLKSGEKLDASDMFCRFGYKKVEKRLGLR